MFKNKKILLFYINEVLFIKKDTNIFIIVILLLVFAFFIPNNFTGKAVDECSGCLNNNICLPTGTRIQDQFCAEDNSLKYQKSQEKKCSQNYQCKSNICAEGQCGSYSTLKQAYCKFREKLNYETEEDCLAQ